MVYLLPNLRKVTCGFTMVGFLRACQRCASRRRVQKATVDFKFYDACGVCIGNVGFNVFECPLDLIPRLIDVVVLPFLVVV